MTADNVQIGAIGVSGGTGDQDEMCAQAGIDAVKDALKQRPRCHWVLPEKACCFVTISVRHVEPFLG
jgi:hypothetical protein